jgi:IS30 family transposase
MGLPCRLIGAEIGRHHRTVWGHLQKLRRPTPVESVRSPLRLSLAEREEISRGLAAGESRRAIARRLRRSPSTIAREVTRNGDPCRYRACTADRAAVSRARRPKTAKLAACPRLRAVVESRLELRWSPQQISAWLVGEFPHDPEMRVSHETIYLSLFVQARGALRKELTRYLRSKHTTRRPRGHSVMNGQGQLRATLNIRERRAEADDRAVPGHWEGDLLMGKRMHAMATLVERKSRFVMLVALPNGHSADMVADALAAKITELASRVGRSVRTTCSERKNLRSARTAAPADRTGHYACMPETGVGLWTSHSMSAQVGVLRPGSVHDARTIRPIGTVQRTKWPLTASPAFLMRDQDDRVLVRVERDARRMSPTWNVFDGERRAVGVILAAMQRYWTSDDIGVSGSVFVDDVFTAQLRGGSFLDAATGAPIAELSLDSELVPPWKNRANHGRWRLRLLAEIEDRARLMVFAWLGVEFDVQWVEDHSPLSRMSWTRDA